MTNLCSYSGTLASAFNSCLRASEPRVPLLWASNLASAASSFVLDNRMERTALAIAVVEEDSQAFKGSKSS